VHKIMSESLPYASYASFEEFLAGRGFDGVNMGNMGLLWVQQALHSESNASVNDDYKSPSIQAACTFIRIQSTTTEMLWAASR